MLISSCTSNEPDYDPETNSFSTRSFPAWFTTYTEAVADLIECQINDENIECVLLSKCENRLPSEAYNRFCRSAQNDGAWEGTEYDWQYTAYLAIEVIEWGYNEHGSWRPIKTKYTLYCLFRGISQGGGNLFSYQLPDEDYEYIDVYNPYYE